MNSATNSLKHITSEQLPSFLSLIKWEFPKIGVHYFGALILRILLFRVLYYELPNDASKIARISNPILKSQAPVGGHFGRVVCQQHSDGQPGPKLQ